MKPAHTAEPWHVLQSVFDPGQLNIGTSYRTCCCVFYDRPEPNDADIAQANAARIVACVNACAGMADPAADLSSLREALRGCLPYVDMCRKLTGGEGDIAAMNARAALDRVQGKEDE